MEDKKKGDRLSIMRNLILIIFVVILLKIIYMTTFKYEHYTTLAENKTYKELPIKAPRGEIKDRYGRLLAGNKNSFTVQVSGNGINRMGPDKKSMANDISLNIINLLEHNGEEYVDEFPIYIENGEFYYTFDKKIKEFKDDYKIPQELNAKESFYYLVDDLINKGILSPEDKRLEASKLQIKLNENNYYPPILVSKWIFTEEKNKKDWLQGYKIMETDISAREAFKKVRSSKYMNIDPEVSNTDARKMMVVRDFIKTQGYSQYNPVTIAKDISQSTISQIEERAMEIPGVYVAKEPIRYYPNGSLASHTIGHMGKMSSYEEELYINKTDKKYYKGDFVGKTGIEKKYEEQLRGTDGYQKVKVDALGRVTQTLDLQEPKSGDTVYLSIDKELQSVAEDSLKRAIEVARTGGTFKSQFGDRTFSTAQPNAKSGAVIAIDVKNGDVLAMASYPDFDPNKFTKSISYDDYKKYLPENNNDLLAPSSLVNLATQGVFQPGSTFKMITAMAAIDKGLSPRYGINDPGHIQLGTRVFADYIWHKSRSNHGYTDLYKAIQESCNIYFYTIATGKNYTGGSDPKVKINADDVLEYAKLFGLDDLTGLNEEIEEQKGTVPNKENKLKTTQTLLKSDIDKKMANSFIDITKDKNPEEYEKRIDEIVSWAAEEVTLTKKQTLERLEKLKVKEEEMDSIADLVVHTYFKFAKWSTADTFNLAIGQGENAYTPAQMARFTAAIANGGNLVELSVVDRTISSDYKSINIDENKKEKIEFKNTEKLNDLIKGMEQVSSQGLAKGIFGNFPISVPTKTGTAEKSGKIPTENEYDYLKDNISYYGVSLSEAEELADKMKKEREEELSKERELEIKKELENKDLEEKERKKLEAELKDGVSVKLDKTDDKINARYLRRAIKELNPNLTDDQIDKYKSNYGAFAWSVGFAPEENPEIAVVVVIPQGNESTYALLPIREIVGKYFGFMDNASDEKKKADEQGDLTQNEGEKSSNIEEEQDINFVPQMKK